MRGYTSLKKVEEAMGRGELTDEAGKYLIALIQIQRILPAEPPRQWSEKRFQHAKALAQIIRNRLEKLISLGKEVSPKPLTGHRPR